MALYGPLSAPMKFIPESHKGPLYEQEKTFESNNLLSRGQRVKTEINEKNAILAPLNQGEMSNSLSKIKELSEVKSVASHLACL